MKAERFWKHLEPLQGALERYWRYSIQDRNAVEDVLLDSVATAFTNFDLFAEGTNFRAWIFRYLNFEILAANRRSLAKPHVELTAEPVADRVETRHSTVPIPAPGRNFDN